MPDSPEKPILSMQGIVKRFPGITANQQVDLDLHTGQIHSLLGENGAGKTTLMKILCGFYQPDEGHISIEGTPVAFRSPADALSHGIGMIHQHFQLVHNFTVTENIILGVQRSLHLNLAEMRKKVAALSGAYGLTVDPDAKISELSVGEQQRVEILRMLFRDVAILVMDEPTAVLTPREVEILFAVMRRMKDEGKSVVFITHKLEEVIEISDAITVLRRGKVMSTLTSSDFRQKHAGIGRELARMMVGREVILDIGKTQAPVGPSLLKVSQLSVLGNRGEPAVRGISFTVKAGEIFAVLGVAGNGQRELVEALVGLRPKQSGDILFPREASTEKSANIAYVPEDRNSRGSVPNMNLLENIALTQRNRFSGGFLFHWPLVKETAETLISHYDIASSSVSMKARHLSGGNLQKLILARELSRNPRLLIAEQPTRGLDIRATEAIWRALLEFRHKGAVLLISGDLKEVLSLADRILVIFRGQAMDIIDYQDEAAIDNIGPLMAGVKTAA